MSPFRRPSPWAERGLQAEFLRYLLRPLSLTERGPVRHTVSDSVNLFLRLRLVDPFKPICRPRKRAGSQNAVRTADLPGPQAGPGPFLSGCHKVRSQRVPLDVPYDREKVPIALCREGFESALPDVPITLVLFVMASDVRGREPLHPGSQIAITVWPQTQVKVVGHETIGENSHRQPFAGQRKKLEEFPIIVWSMKHHRVRVAAIHHVVTDVARGCPCRSWHGQIVARELDREKGTFYFSLPVQGASGNWQRQSSYHFDSDDRGGKVECPLFASLPCGWSV